MSNTRLLIAKNLSKFTKSELDSFFKTAKCIKKNQAFTFLINTASQSYGRILVITPRKVGNSPERNLLRRRMKAIFWEENLYEHKQDLIVVTRSHAKTYDFLQLKILLISLFAKTQPSAQPDTQQ